MKTEFLDVSETRKSLVVEIPSAIVDAEIDRVARDYSRAARIPGFRPGKVPAGLVKQRFRDQILQDVAHGLIPRAVDDALRERGIEPIEMPHIQDVLVEEGRPLKFTASFETVPPIDFGEYEAIRLRRPPVTVSDEEVDQALERLRRRAARYEPVEDRPVEMGDTLVADLERSAGRPPQRHDNISIDVGAQGNPPGFDEELVGLTTGTRKEFILRYPADYALRELAGTSVSYAVVVKDIRRRLVPELDDEFAKDLGDCETLAELRQRVRQDLALQAEREADRDLRSDLLRQLADRLPFDLPVALLDREMDRRVDEFAQRLAEEQIDPRRTQVNWSEFREAQREAAQVAVASALVLDEVARRESLTVTQEEIDREVGAYAERTGRAMAAVRAQLDRDAGIARLATGLRREKAVDFLLARARIAIE